MHDTTRHTRTAFAMRLPRASLPDPTVPFQRTDICTRTDGRRERRPQHAMNANVTEPCAPPLHTPSHDRQIKNATHPYSHLDLARKACTSAAAWSPAAPAAAVPDARAGPQDGMRRRACSARGTHAPAEPADRFPLYKFWQGRRGAHGGVWRANGAPPVADCGSRSRSPRCSSARRCRRTQWTTPARTAIRGAGTDWCPGVAFCVPHGIACPTSSLGPQGAAPDRPVQARQDASTSPWFPT